MALGGFRALFSTAFWRCSAVASVLTLVAGLAWAQAPCEIDTLRRQPEPAAPVLLVLLSPRMVYALQEWPRMDATAQLAGFRVVACRDPRVPLDEWQAAARQVDWPEGQGLPALGEDEARRHGLLNHAPSALVMARGCVHPWPVLGVMPDAAWRAVLMARRADLEQAAPACPLA